MAQHKLSSKRKLQGKHQCQAQLSSALHDLQAASQILVQPHPAIALLEDAAKRIDVALQFYRSFRLGGARLARQIEREKAHVAGLKDKVNAIPLTAEEKTLKRKENTQKRQKIL